MGDGVSADCTIAVAVNRRVTPDSRTAEEVWAPGTHCTMRCGDGRLVLLDGDGRTRWRGR